MLNAHRIAAEAEIVAQAGQPGEVTVSTNMAGRGTDIKLGEGCAGDGRAARDLHRTARLGPHRPAADGTLRSAGRSRAASASIWPLDDDILLAGFGPNKAARLRERRGSNGGRDL